MRVFRRKTWLQRVKPFFPLVFCALLLMVFIAAAQRVQEQSRAEGLQTLEEAIRRATVHCYAVEGQYPPNLAYLMQNYGIHIDTKKYTVYYDQFASNLMPDITVLEASGGWS